MLILLYILKILKSYYGLFLEISIYYNGNLLRGRGVKFI